MRYCDGAECCRWYHRDCLTEVPWEESGDRFPERLRWKPFGIGAEKWWEYLRHPLERTGYREGEARYEVFLGEVRRYGRNLPEGVDPLWGVEGYARRMLRLVRKVRHEDVEQDVDQMNLWFCWFSDGIYKEWLSYECPKCNAII